MTFYEPNPDKKFLRGSDGKFIRSKDGRFLPLDWFDGYDYGDTSYWSYFNAQDIVRFYFDEGYYNVPEKILIEKGFVKVEGKWVYKNKHL